MGQVHGDLRGAVGTAMLQAVLWCGRKTLNENGERSGVEAGGEG